MNTLRTAAQQALAQLEINRTNFRKGPSKSICKMLAGGNDEVIEALKAALAEPQKTHSADCYKWHHQCAIAEVQRLRAALAEPCPCGDRPADQCPGEWEPGCDLGNPKYAKRAEPVQEPDLYHCPNCASLEAQNSELDRKLAEMEREPLSEEEIWRAANEWMGSDDKVVNLARAIEVAHGIIESGIKGDKDE